MALGVPAGQVMSNELGVSVEARVPSGGGGGGGGTVPAPEPGQETAPAGEFKPADVREAVRDGVAVFRSEGDSVRLTLTTNALGGASVPVRVECAVAALEIGAASVRPGEYAVLPASVPVEFRRGALLGGAVEIRIPDGVPVAVTLKVVPDGVAFVARVEDGRAIPLPGEAAAGGVRALVQKGGVYVSVAVQGFADMPRHWATRYAAYAFASGFASGYPDGTFRPERSITRAETAKMLASFLNLQEAPATFADVPAGAWYAGAVGAVAKAGLVRGTGKGFEPERPITRAEAAKIVAGAVWERLRQRQQIGGSGALSRFADVAGIPEWAAGEIDFLAARGVIAGYPDGTFKPGIPVTRAEFAAMVYRATEAFNLR